MSRAVRMAFLIIALLVGAGSIEFRPVALGEVGAPESTVAVPYYHPPSRMELFGEPVPLVVQDVWERFDREFTLVVYNHAQVYLWLKRTERYFPRLEEQLRLYGLPDDLKYVAVAESDLMTTASSPAGAVGPWQFIAVTGRNYGLALTAAVDERHSFEAATDSAFRYLRDLQGLFRSWTLAVAAYNCGENRVKEEIGRQKTSDYYQLKLPLETERYIFRILAIKEVLSNPEKYGYRLPPGAGYPEIKVDKVSIALAAPMPIQTIAEAAGMTYREFKILNPAFISDAIPAGSFMVATPRGKGGALQNRLEQLKAADKDHPAYADYTVKKGETLSAIAAFYKVSVQDLRKCNNLADDKVEPGQTLKVPRQ